MERFENNKNRRSEEQIKGLIDQAIEEVVVGFSGEMTDRDKDLLLSLAAERGTNSSGKIVALRQVVDGVGVSENIKDYVNQIFQTLRQQLTTEEQALYEGWSNGHHLLNDL